MLQESDAQRVKPRPAAGTPVQSYLVRNYIWPPEDRLPDDIGWIDADGLRSLYSDLPKQAAGAAVFALRTPGLTKGPAQAAYLTAMTAEGKPTAARWTRVHGNRTDGIFSLEVSVIPELRGSIAVCNGPFDAVALALTRGFDEVRASCGTEHFNMDMCRNRGDHDIVLVPSLEITSKQIQPLMGKLQRAGAHVRVQSLYGRKSASDRVRWVMREIIQREAPIIQRNAAKMGHRITYAEAEVWAWTTNHDQAVNALILPIIPSGQKLPSTGLKAVIEDLWAVIKWGLILTIIIGIIAYLVGSQ